MKSPILITGVAGFIGTSTAISFLKEGRHIIGIDALLRDDSKSVGKRNLEKLKKYHKFIFYNTDVRNNEIAEIISKYNIKKIIHLAALTGVRKSLLYPKLYKDINTNGTKNIFTIAQEKNIEDFVFASSSSVYGNSKHVPFSETQKLNPQTPYAKSKYNAEKLLQKMGTTLNTRIKIVRFFSVYGPQGRTDMAPFLFTKAAFTNTKITQFGKGLTARDYTYIDDIVSGIKNALEIKNRFEIINLGNSSPIKLNDLIHTIEQITKKKINIILKPENKLESKITYADIAKAKKLLKWQPKTQFKIGMKKFVDWYKEEYI